MGILKIIQLSPARGLIIYYYSLDIFQTIYLPKMSNSGQDNKMAQENQQGLSSDSLALTLSQTHSNIMEFSTK